MAAPGPWHHTWTLPPPLVPPLYHHPCHRHIPSPAPTAGAPRALLTTGAFALPCKHHFLQEPKERSGLGEEKGAGNPIPGWWKAGTFGVQWTPVTSAGSGHKRAPALPQSPWAAHGFGKWAFPSLSGRDVLDVKYPETLGCQTPRQGTHSPPQVTHTVQLLGHRHSGSVTGQNETAQHHREPGCSCHAQPRSSIALREGFGSLVNTKANKKTKCRAQRSQDMAQPAPTAKSTHC